MNLITVALTKVKMIGAVVMTFVKTVASGTTEATEQITYDLFAPIVQAFNNQINPGTIIAILAGVIAAGIALVFMWWGLRKLVAVLMTAFKKGKLKF